MVGRGQQCGHRSVNGTLRATHILTNSNRLTSLKTQNSNEMGWEGEGEGAVEVVLREDRDREGGRGERGWGEERPRGGISCAAGSVMEEGRPDTGVDRLEGTRGGNSRVGGDRC